MSIKLGQGFKITSTEVIDTRLVLTKAQMLAVNDKTMPAKYFALCSDDNKIYCYDKSITTPSAETGKFFTDNTISAVVLRGYYYNGLFYVDPEHTLECEKNLNLVYVDKHQLGMIYTWDGASYVPSFRINNSALAFVDNKLEIKGYSAAAVGQLPTKSANGVTWIDQDAALSEQEIREVLN